MEGSQPPSAALLAAEGGPLLPGSSASPRRSIPVMIGRRLMRGPGTAAVREATGAQFEERWDWGYSRPMVALDLAWNLSFVLVSCSVLVVTAGERPSTPVRGWILGYAVQCVIHVGFVCFEYQRRRRRGNGSSDDGQENRLVKNLESLNAVVSFLWWILGFYWIVVGGQNLLQDAPRLYWLSVVFLAFDVFFAIFCIMLACIIGITLCCCMPCIIAYLYSVMGQEGASDNDLSTLPKFRFRQASHQEKFDLFREQVVAITVVEQDVLGSMNDLSLPPDDSECCICLSQYVDGVELHSLPCKHHFHSGCIVKWLRINATCPLCKYSILRADDRV